MNKLHEKYKRIAHDIVGQRKRKDIKISIEESKSRFFTKLDQDEQLSVSDKINLYQYLVDKLNEI